MCTDCNINNSTLSHDTWEHSCTDNCVWVHQGSLLSPLLFAIVNDVATNEIKVGMLHEILYAVDIVLIAETMVLVAETVVLVAETVVMVAETVVLVAETMAEQH